MSAFICCPSCGTKIEIVPVSTAVQAELPLGPIEVSQKKKLDGFDQKLIKSNDSRFDSDSPIENSARNDSNDSIRFDSSIASCEEDLIETVKRFVGEKEFALNGKLWWFYFRQSPKALAYAIEDWKLRTPDQQRLIKNRPAWLTDRYKRAHSEIIKARKTA
jgi:hypothetical protein